MGDAQIALDPNPAPAHMETIQFKQGLPLPGREGQIAEFEVGPSLP